jgi:polyphosphate kinase
VFYFHNDGNSEIYCASADWMERNFFRRIEVAFPIERRQHRERILQDLQIYLADNSETWVLHADGSYERPPTVDPKQSAQQQLLLRHAESVG